MIEEVNLFADSQEDKVSFMDMLNELSLKKYSPDKFGSRIRSFSKKSNSKIKTLSLFSGAGGLDIGFEDAGFEILEQNELVQDFSKTLELNNINNHNIICKDIRNYSGKKWKGKIDFIIGGPPCQPFSSAARRAFGVDGTIDARGTLFNEYVRILEEIQPKGFLFENVYGIVSSNKGQDWKMITTAFEKAGYNIYHKILNAADYGTPQHRARLIIVGLRDKTNYKFPLPTHGPDSPDNLNYFSAKEAIKNLNEVHIKTKDIGGKYGYLLNDIPVGMNYSYYTSKVGNPVSIFSWRSKFSDFLYKADPNQPVKTIKASGGQYTGPFHWDSRRFTIKELKRLQTFPDNYEINGSKMIKIKQIGNSVPPQFARILALSIRDQVFNLTMPFKLNYMSKNYKLSFNKYKRNLSKTYYNEVIAKFKNTKNQSLSLKNSHRFVNLNKKLNFEITHKDKSNFEYTFMIKGKKININLTNSKKDEDKTLKIKIKLDKSINNKYNSIDYIINSSNPLAYTAAWKALEFELSHQRIKGDLVQLNGYYQYTPNMKISGVFPNHFPIDNSLMQLIIENKITNTLLTIDELSKMTNLKNDVILDNLKSLKSLGYEVRNSNTNVQIPKNYWMIPYAFPTLSNVSVQMYKRL